MSDAKDLVVEVWIMHTPRGTFSFGYKMGDAPVSFKKPPVWMEDFKKRWDKPSDPVTFEFTLTDESYIQDAFNYLYNGPANGISYPAEESAS